MYALYETSATSDGKRRYPFQKRVSLFGSKSGYIPWLLTHQLDPASSEPKKWHVEISDALSTADCQMKEAEEIVEENQNEFRAAWHQHFGS